MDIWLINHYAVPPRYYPLIRQTCFAKYLMAMGHTVTIFAASTVHNSDKNLITDGSPWREETVDGVRYVYIKCRDYRGNGLRRIYNMCEFAWKLPGVCGRFPRPDAIVATSVPPTSCAMGIRLARKYGCRGVAEIADLWPESIVAYGIAGPHNPAVIALRWLEKWLYTKADAVVFTMEGAYDYIVERGWDKDVPRSKVHYINNGVDLEAFDYNREHFRVEDGDLNNAEKFNVVYTGSVRRVNHLGSLLDVAKQVTSPQIRFLIWGDGDEREALERRAREENITNVVFKGHVEKKYVPSIVSQADMNYMHGEEVPLERFGTSSNKLFEYFAAEKPILCDFLCSYNPSVTYGAAKEVSGADPKRVAREIERMASLSREQLQVYCGNARRAAEEYDFKNLTQKLVEVIEGVES